MTSDYRRGGLDFARYLRADETVRRYTPRFDAFMAGLTGILALFMIAAGLADREWALVAFGVFPFSILSCLVFANRKFSRENYNEAVAYMEEYRERLRNETPDPRRAIG